MNRCLACHETFIAAVGWWKLLMLEPESLLCSLCEAELERISGRTCKICSRPVERLDESYMKEDLCLDCWRWEQREDTANLLERNISLYEYNNFLKEWLATYKYRGDAEIATYFSPHLKKVHQTHFRSYIPIAMPLSSERLHSRGFNQSALLLSPWAEDHPVLLRTTGEKQSKKSRKKRINQFAQNPFRINLKSTSIIQNKNVLLIDDVYTTGTTLRQAAKVLKDTGALKVASITIAR